MELDYTTIIMALTPVVLLLVEYFLGEAKVPKANSIIAALLGLVKSLTGKKS